MSLTVKIGHEATIVESMQSAAEEWCKHRDAHNLGASESPSVCVYRDCAKIARISYNGRIWDLDGNEILPLQIQVTAKHNPRLQG
jgi:hypothetical protein